MTNQGIQETNRICACLTKLVWLPGVLAAHVGGCAASPEGRSQSEDLATSTDALGFRRPHPGRRPHVGERFLAGARNDFIIEGTFTGYGTGSVSCPPDTFAIGGGSDCTGGDFDVTYPLTATIAGYTEGPVPIGWAEWHRGASDNDCNVYAVCAPRVWFGPTDIKTVKNSTGAGDGEVACGSDFMAVGGGRWCDNGEMQLAYPNSTLSGWVQYHRGFSSNDCEVYANCVRSTHWLTRAEFRTETFTGYGNGSTTCGEATALGGGTYCTGGDIDFNYPSFDVTGWIETHRGTSSNDCSVSAACVSDSIYDLVEVGAPCGTGRIRDCALNCVDRIEAYTRMHDEVCDNGATGTGYDLFCEEFNFDSGECI